MNILKVMGISILVLEPGKAPQEISLQIHSMTNEGNRLPSDGGAQAVALTIS
jgi:hypothetical protein